MLSFSDYQTKIEERKVLIANRLRQLRKEHAYTQAQLSELLGYSEPTVKKWERKDGKNPIPTMEQLFNLATLYECEIEFLLCEIDCKTRTAADIQRETGLSEAAIDILKKEAEKLQKINKSKFISADLKTSMLQDFINIILENNAQLMDYIRKLVRAKNAYNHLAKEGIFSEVIALYDEISKNEDTVFFETSKNAAKFYDGLEKILENNLKEAKSKIEEMAKDGDFILPDNEELKEFVGQIDIDMGPYFDTYEIIANYRNSKPLEYAISSSLMELVNLLIEKR